MTPGQFTITPPMVTAINGALGKAVLVPEDTGKVLAVTSQGISIDRSVTNTHPDGFSAAHSEQLRIRFDGQVNVTGLQTLHSPFSRSSMIVDATATPPTRVDPKRVGEVFQALLGIRVINAERVDALRIEMGLAATG